MTTNNMYRIGDYVYFEQSSNQPYNIRRIDELNKLSNGSVEAKVTCFFRRRDLTAQLCSVADKQLPTEDEELITPVQKHQLKFRELFISRISETISATLIRGKCYVNLLNETESLITYLNQEDSFFYWLVYDPNQKTLLNEYGEIRIGSRYQADITNLLTDSEDDGRECEDMETLVWTTNHDLTDRQIDQFLVTSRSVGTFARALDCSSSVKQPSLHMSAAAASRDITLFYAMDSLFKHKYNICDALSSLIPTTGPVLCRDELEEWSASEANLFEEAVEKYGKDFHDIRADFLPWKSLKNIIEYYYMWKTTDRYVQQKRVKAVEAESKLKQVFVPNYTKNKQFMSNGAPLNEVVSVKPCESCLSTSSIQWFNWGTNKICNDCWDYYKKYGGLQSPGKIDNEFEYVKKKSGNISDDERIQPLSLAITRFYRCTFIGCGKEFKVKSQLTRHYTHTHGLPANPVSPRQMMKQKKTAFYLMPSLLAKISRRICKRLIRSRHAARSPFWPINCSLVRQEMQVELMGKNVNDIKDMFFSRRRTRGSVTVIATRLAFSKNQDLVVPTWLAPSEQYKIPRVEAFPKPPKAPDGSLMYPRVPNKMHTQLHTSELPLNFHNPLNYRRSKHAEQIINGSLNSPTTWNSGLALDLKRSEPSPAPQLHTMGGVLPARPMPGISIPPQIPQIPSSHLQAQQSATIQSQSHPPIIHRTTHPHRINHVNGKTRMAAMTRVGRKSMASWNDAPDDLYFKSTDRMKKVRKLLSVNELKRSARKPWGKFLRIREPDIILID